MVYEKFHTQKEIRKKNEDKILLELKESPKRFKDLQNKLNFSPMGLKKILSRLKEEQEIEKVMYQGHEAYSLTKKGKRTVEEIPMMLDSIEQIMSDKHSYRNVIGKYSLGYKGISYDVMHNELGNYKLFGLFENTFKETLSNFEKDVGKIPDIVENESELKGKIVFAITLDFDDMIKRFKQFKEGKPKDSRFLRMEWENEEAWTKLVYGFGHDGTKNIY
ncbi:MAG: winged helix-turn-helix transcriptional regulator [Candidatus Parvarchaeota archaeon]